MMTSMHPESFYDAKRAIAETTFSGFDGSAVNKYAAEIVSVLGWEIPAPDAIPGSKQTVKVYRVHLVDVPADIRARAGSKRGALGTTSAGYLVAASKKDAAALTRPEWARRDTRDIVEVDPSDYRYRLAADNPGSIVLTEGSTEFGALILLPVRSVEEA